MERQIKNLMIKKSLSLKREKEAYEKRFKTTIWLSSIRLNYNGTKEKKLNHVA